MKIGLNATCLNDRPSGARQRFVGIYGELVRRHPEFEFVIYEPTDCRVGAWFGGASNVLTKHTPLPSEGRAGKLVNGFGYWGAALRSEGLDIFEGFNLPLVKLPDGRTVLTVHDIRGLHTEHGPVSRAVYKSVLGRSLKAADHVITVSEAMKDEIQSFYSGVPITVIYNGLDASGFDRVPESDAQAFRRKHELAEGFVLAIGHLEKRKNYLRLVDAIALLRDRGRPCSLVIIGNDSGEKNAIEERISSRKLSGHVKILSRLSDLEVRCAYQLCSLFVFPSSYEGFGIPIVEAMAAGCPMVLSDIPVFREITQDGGIYFPGADVDAMASAIDRGLSDSSERARQIAYGRKRVKDFSFKSLAGQLEALYRVML